jgi:TatA/E family protein of Tat protein translocase
MFANMLGSDGLIVLVVAFVVLFGGSQLPKLAKNVGSAGREFRKAQMEAEAHHAASAAAEAMTAPAVVAPAVVAPAAVAPAVVAPESVAPAAATAPQAGLASGAPAVDGDLMVVSRAELKRQLAGILEERDSSIAH